jgi:hypothetical protein
LLSHAAIQQRGHEVPVGFALDSGARSDQIIAHIKRADFDLDGAAVHTVSGAEQLQDLGGFVAVGDDAHDGTGWGQRHSISTLLGHQTSRIEGGRYRPRSSSSKLGSGSGFHSV